MPCLEPDGHAIGRGLGFTPYGVVESRGPARALWEPARPLLPRIGVRLPWLWLRATSGCSTIASLDPAAWAAAVTAARPASSPPIRPRPPPRLTGRRHDAGSASIPLCLRRLRHPAAADRTNWPAMAPRRVTAPMRCAAAPGCGRAACRRRRTDAAQRLWAPRQPRRCTPTAEPAPAPQMAANARPAAASAGGARAPPPTPRSACRRAAPNVQTASMPAASPVGPLSAAAAPRASPQFPRCPQSRRYAAA